jgi:hypothetical protein
MQPLLPILQGAEGVFVPKGFSVRETSKRIPAEAQRSKDELGRELNEAGVRSRVCTVHDAKSGIVARTASSVWRGKLSAVEEIEKLHTKFELGAVLPAERNSLERREVEIVHTVRTHGWIDARL